jgi:hypothetical protein
MVGRYEVLNSKCKYENVLEINESLLLMFFKINRLHEINVFLL